MIEERLHTKSNLLVAGPWSHCFAWFDARMHVTHTTPLLHSHILPHSFDLIEHYYTRQE